MVLQVIYIHLDMTFLNAFAVQMILQDSFLSNFYLGQKKSEVIGILNVLLELQLLHTNLSVMSIPGS